MTSPGCVLPGLVPAWPLHAPVDATSPLQQEPKSQYYRISANIMRCHWAVRWSSARGGRRAILTLVGTQMRCALVTDVVRAGGLRVSTSTPARGS
jgi:hypothetical protein